VLAGPRCLYFLEFHQDRGIELASSYAAFLGLLKACGYQLTVQSSHGSADVIAPLAPLLTRVAPLLLGLLLLGATLLWFWAAVRRAAQGAEEQPVSRTLAHAFGPELAGFTLLFLLLFVLGNKVFSPQYLLWLAPLAALVPLAGWRRHVFLWGFVAVCVWNRQIFPGNLRELYGPILTMTPPTAAGPTPLGTFLLVGRTLALIGLTGLLTHGLLRRHRAVTSAAEAVSPGPRALPQLPQAAA